jgi:non-specific serine/threonine protein kinase/serine/threonine-protein kinase
VSGDERDSGALREDRSKDEPASNASTEMGSVKDSVPVAAEPAIRLPNYRILELVGSGGMGEVYAAQQERPMRRKVALKVIKLGMDSRRIVARFESERQALALMSHPNIANVYDAGTTEQGRPFFSMEYVEGIPITAYCDRYRLSIQGRLELFLKVCEGVQHAHQKGIIHRDLKPSNVLVTIQDEVAVPKIIDFGLAKATSHQLSEESMHTRLGTMIGTPEYMSPEQVEMSGLDIDTRSDIYSLGVLLYVLLVGTLPFSFKQIRSSAPEEIRRVIREVEPARPSSRLSTLEDNAPRVAQRRNWELSSLVKRIRGDLDWITMKALEKDRTRRYQTANALALDIRRHLGHEPVAAGPPSTAYRARKFVRRHRIGVAAALLVAALVVAGTVGTALGFLRAVRAERVANEEAEAARQVSDFLLDLFRVSDPHVAQGDSITARQILDEGSRRISRELRDQPLTQARLMDTMGTVYRYLGLFEESRTLLEPALQTREDLLDGDSLEVAESLHNLAQLEHQQGRYHEAQVLAQRALAIREAQLRPEDLRVADSLMDVAWSFFGQSDHDRAALLFERALAIKESTLGSDHSDVADIRRRLGNTHSRRGDAEAAERLLLQALATYERALEPDDYSLGLILNDLANFYRDQGRLAEAVPLLERAIAIKERVVGPDHTSVAYSLNNLALIYDGQDRPSEAEPILRRALAILESSFGSEHDTTALGLANLAWVAYRQGKYDEAEPLYERALGIYERTVGPNHRSVAILLRDQARLYADQSLYPRAEELLKRSAGIWETIGGPDHPDLAECLDSLADLYVEQGKLVDAEPHYQRALAIRETRLGRDHSATLESLAAYADLLRQTGRPVDAENLERNLGTL